MAATIPNDNITLPTNWRGYAPVLIAIGAVCILLSLGLFYFTGSEVNRGLGYKAFFHSYLANFMFCLSICLGALFYVMVHYLVRASWSTSILRLAQLLAFTIPWLALLFLPILAMVLFTNSAALYGWNVGRGAGLPAMVEAKLGYLNPG
ncbi:MAG: hypothetical protein KDA45_12680, partial [Planctomycetales bacterium]|nr:hypothetical protein [Planctomycetales bacterium]